VLDLISLGLRGSANTDLNDTFGLRQTVTRLALGQALFHPTPRIPVRGNTAMFPSPEQLKPMNALSMPWLWSLTNAVQDFEQITRSTLFVADEGGMGKTYSCAIALNWLKKEQPGNILVVCPPTLRYTWMLCIEKFGYKPNLLSAMDYREGKLSEGFNIISSFSVAKAPLYEQVQEKYRRNLTAVLLDEAHNGMPADNVHAQSFNSLISTAKVRIMVSATPMRRDITDLFSLLNATCEHTEDAEIAAIMQDKFTNNENLILTQWIPILNRLKSGEQNDQDIIFLQANWSKVLPLAGEEMERFEPYLDNLSSVIPDLAVNERVLLAQDLHPLGRFLSCTLRDDLGEDICNTLYRTMSSQTIPFTLSDNYKNNINEIGGLIIEGKANAKILKSCILNVEKPYYSSFDDIELTDELREQCSQAWRRDFRIEKLSDLIHKEYKLKVDPDNHRAHAVIIFCEWKGTIESLKSILSELFDDLEINVEIHTPTLNEDEEDDDRYNSNARRISNKLYDIGKDARYSSSLQVVICGKAVAEGHSLNWATHIVHWDMPTRQSEVIAQRNWRLDRRISNEWQRQNYSNQFRITYLIDDESDGREFLNKHYSRNRRFLGHRGHIESPAENHLIPMTNNEWVSRDWSPVPQECMGTNSFQVRRLFDYLEGNLADHDGLASAFMNRVLLELLSVHPHGMESIYNHGIEFTGHMGFDSQVYNILLRLASVEERMELAKLTPQIKLSKLISRWGLPGGEGVLFSIEPTGRLGLSLLDLSLLNTEHNNAFDGEDFPFTFNGQGSSLIIHTGILNIVNGPAGNHLRTYWRDSMPTAFFVRDAYDENQPYRNLTLKELQNNVFLKKIERMNEGDYRRLPVEDYIFNRAEHIDSIEDYRVLMQPTELDPNGNAGAHALSDMLEANKALEQLDLLEPTPEMIVPVYRHSSRTYPDDAATMYLKLMKETRHRENSHSHGWW
jgi:hypothetical protein